LYGELLFGQLKIHGMDLGLFLVKLK